MSVGESQCVPSLRTYRTNCYSENCSGWILMCAKFQDLQCYSQNVSGWISVCAKFQDSQDKVLWSECQWVNLNVCQVSGTHSVIVPSLPEIWKFISANLWCSPFKGLSSTGSTSSLLHQVCIDHTKKLGTDAEVIHLPFNTAPECCTGSTQSCTLM